MFCSQPQAIGGASWLALLLAGLDRPVGLSALGVGLAELFGELLALFQGPFQQLDRFWVLPAEPAVLAVNLKAQDHRQAGNR